MRALGFLVIAFFATLPSVGSAQSATSYYDQVVSADDHTTCDDTGWSVLDSEMTTTQTEGFMREHAACVRGENGLVLLTGCLEPLHQTLIEIGPKPGEAWVACSVMVANGTVDDFVLTPADFSLFDTAGNQYPYSLEASVTGGDSTLRAQTLPPGSDPVIGLVGFAVPEDLTPPYLLVWEPGVNGVPLDPTWIVVDRFIELPEALT